MTVKERNEGVVTSETKYHIEGVFENLAEEHTGALLPLDKFENIHKLMFRYFFQFFRLFAYRVACHSIQSRPCTRRRVLLFPSLQTSSTGPK